MFKLLKKLNSNPIQKQIKIDLNDFNKMYSDPKGSTKNDGPNNMILSENIRLNLDSYVTKRNNGVCVTGPAGSDKFRCFFKPNILQANTNYIVTDIGGELYRSTGDFLKQQGYNVKVLNLLELNKSECYNPFTYIKDDLDVLNMVNNIIKNTVPKGTIAATDPFFGKSEYCLLKSLCFYLVKHRPKEEQNFNSIMKLLKAAYVDDENTKSELDCIFEEIEKTDPDSLAIKSYKTFKLGAGRNSKQYLISLSIRLSVFNLNQIQNLTNKDTLDLYSIRKEKTALFIVLPVTDDIYNFLATLLLEQLFNILRNHHEYINGELVYVKPVYHIRFFLDNVCSIGKIPEFAQHINVIRLWNASCSYYVHNINELKSLYPNDWQVIIGTCDSILCLLDNNPNYEISEFINEKNKKYCNVSVSKKSSAVLEKCDIYIKDIGYFTDNKYDYKKHPNYKYIAEKTKGENI